MGLAFVPQDTGLFFYDALLVEMLPISLPALAEIERPENARLAADTRPRNADYGTRAGSLALMRRCGRRLRRVLS